MYVKSNEVKLEMYLSYKQSINMPTSALVRTAPGCDHPSETLPQDKKIDTIQYVVLYQFIISIKY